MSEDNLTNTTFPLYDHLLDKVTKLSLQLNKEIDINVDEVRELVEGVKHFNQLDYESLFTIIRIYSLRNTETKIFDVPFNGEKLNSQQNDKYNVKFDIRQFPPTLRKILLEFVRMVKHSKQEQ
jgi:hypothetical protein